MLFFSPAFKCDVNTADKWGTYTVVDLGPQLAQERVTRSITAPSFLPSLWPSPTVRPLVAHWFPRLVSVSCSCSLCVHPALYSLTGPAGHRAVSYRTVPSDRPFPVLGISLPGMPGLPGLPGVPRWQLPPRSPSTTAFRPFLADKMQSTTYVPPACQPHKVGIFEAANVSQAHPSLAVFEMLDKLTD